MSAGLASTSRLRPLADHAAPSAWVTLALAYYWIYLYAHPLLPDARESTLAHTIVVAPIAGIATFAWLARTIGDRRAGGMPSTAPLWCFIVLATLASMIRFDWATIFSAGLFGVTLLWLTQVPSRVGPSLVNAFFGLSIVTGALTHVGGLSEYGWWPGQHRAGEEEGVEWRVSVFPYVPESAFLALVVLLVNQTLGRGYARWSWMALASYYLVLSGVRTALLAFVFCEVYLLISRSWPRSAIARRRTLLAALLGAFIFVVLGSETLLLWPGLAEGPLGIFVLRSAAQDLSAESLSRSIYRNWLWWQHLQLFASNPLTGVGTFDFASAVPELLVEGHEVSGSESFLTSWLARLGLCFLPFAYFFARLFGRAAQRANDLDACLCLTLAIASLGYGSFIAPYNFMFLLILALLLRERETALNTTPNEKSRLP